ncbi:MULTISPECIES: OmpA family protein [Phaeobacter]|uniref:OmpA family protein n=1 Tax=Phaeobacter TaxID=302485 RepID=UPI00058BCC88|nr:MULTISPECIES: OmpA family protein [Phaeobacter]KII12192.1 membrane protein [Phaeobacter sp. S60]UTS79508.1 Peptidoglycan-associated lipoprotein [Phaeobacter piscinae]
MIRYAALFGLSLTVAACEYEAGEPLDRSVFGNATNSNAAVMAGERDFAIQLATRFAEEVPTTITFAFDSAQLDGNARAVLDQQAHWIRQFPEVRFRVFGHTDAVGSASYNKALGLRRARAAVNYLVGRGISRSRLQAVVSFGETQPLIPTPDRERRNRRTVTEVSGFLKRHPTVLDGKYAQIIYREYVESAVPRTSLTSERSIKTTLE